MGVSSRRCNDFSIDAIFGTRRVLDHQDYDRLEGASSLQTGVVNQEIEEPRYPTTISECSSPCESSQTNSTAYDQPRTFAYPSSASADVSSVRVRPNTDHHAINPNRIVVVPQGHTYHHVHPTQQIILPCEASYSDSRSYVYMPLAHDQQHMYRDTRPESGLIFSPADSRHSCRMSKQRRKPPRTHYSIEQKWMMEELFKSKQYLSHEERVSVASRVQLTEQQIKIWFQNRRYKTKKTH